MYFLLAFIAIPLIEIAVFINVGDLIGLWWTLIVIVATALGGAAMLRYQGVAALYQAIDHLKNGKIPLKEVFDGLCLLIAGALLLTPGFVTDIAGSLLFFPLIRTCLGYMITRHIIARGTFQEQAHATARRHRANQGSKGTTIIDGEFEEVEPESINTPCEEPDNTRNI